MRYGLHFDTNNWSTLFCDFWFDCQLQNQQFRLPEASNASGRNYFGNEIQS